MTTGSPPSTNKIGISALLESSAVTFRSSTGGSLLIAIMFTVTGTVAVLLAGSRATTVN